MSSEHRSAELRRKAAELQARSARALRQSAALRAASDDLRAQVAENTRDLTVSAAEARATLAGRAADGDPAADRGEP